MATGPLRSLLISAPGLLALLQSPQGSEHQRGPGPGLGTRLGSPAASWAHASLGSPCAAHTPCPPRRGTQQEAPPPSRHPGRGAWSAHPLHTSLSPPLALLPLPAPFFAPSLPPPDLPAAASFSVSKRHHCRPTAFRLCLTPLPPAAGLAPRGRGGSGARSRCPLGALQDLSARVWGRQAATSDCPAGKPGWRGRG